MATKYSKFHALAALVAFGSLLPVACNGDDDTNPTPTTGGTGGKGGSGGKGGTGAKGGSSGSSGEAGTGDTGTGGSTGGTGAKGGTGGTGGTGAKGGTGGSGAKGGTGNKGGTGGSSGANDAGSSGENSGPTVHDCTDDDLTADACYGACKPVQSDDSEQFLNHCSDGSQTLGGIPADCTPWIGTLNALGNGCTKLGPGCVLPDLP